MRGLGLLVLRVAIGVVSVMDGLPKLVPIWGNGPAQALLESAGVASAYPATVGTGIAEVVGGGLLIAGAYTPWVAVLLAVTTGITTWVLHLPSGVVNWTSELGVGRGVEFEFLRISTLLCLMMTGPGALSYDTRRTRERARSKSQKAEAKKKKP